MGVVDVKKKGREQGREEVREVRRGKQGRGQDGD